MDNNDLPAQKNTSNGLSAADFQRNLFNWFENRGLLDELRTRLRQQMVEALRDTSLRPSSSRRLRPNVSPKIQAINLLVAEFLLQQDHHYTLSVFTSEVPLLRSIPEFTTSGTQISARSNTLGENMPRFHHQDAKDIMEILGLSLDTELGSRIYRQYQENSEGIALLICVLQNSPFILEDRSRNGENNVIPGPSGIKNPVREKKTNMNSKNVEHSNKEENTIKNLSEFYDTKMQHILYQSQMKSQHIKQLQEEIRRFQDSEVKRVRQEEEAKYKKELIERESRIQADLCRREEKITQKVKDAEEKLTLRQRSVDNELEVKKQNLSELATQLQEQRMEVAHKLQEVVDHAEELKHQERMIEETKQKEALFLAERTSELDIQQQRLREEFKRLNSERETIGYIQREIEENRLHLIEASKSLAHSQSQATFLHDLQHQCKQLRLELDTTRLKLDTLTDLQSQKQSFAKVSDDRKHSVERTDKCLQTVMPLSLDDLAAAVPVQDRTMELEFAQSQQQLLLQQEQHQYLTDLLRQVQQENQELRGHTQQQRLRIDELTSHAAQLANQLEHAQTALTLLSNHPMPEPSLLNPNILTSVFLPHDSGTISVQPLLGSAPPPPPPPLPPHSSHPVLRTVQSQQMGAGEELNYIPSSSTVQPTTPVIPMSSQQSNLSHRREWRKKPPRRLTVYNNTTSSDETSPTEEILQEARRRLRRLEEESEAVDRSYRDFRQRHSESLAASTSILFHPIIHPVRFHQQNTNLDYGSFVTGQPLYSSATGGNQRLLPSFIFRNTNYNVPSFPQQSGTSFNPMYPSTTTTHVSPLFQTERIPTSVQCAVGNRTQNSYTFPQQRETSITNDNNVILDRFITQSQSRETAETFVTSSTILPKASPPCTDFRLALQSQPSTNVDLNSRRGNEQNIQFRSNNKQMNFESTQRGRLDIYNNAPIVPPFFRQHQAKTLSFSGLMTTVYNSPQVSSSVDNSANQNDAQKMSNGGANKDLTLMKTNPVPSISQESRKSSTHRPLSTTLDSSRSDSLSDDFVIRGIDDLPSCVASSTSGTQDDEWISSQIQKKNTGEDTLNCGRKCNVTNRLHSGDIQELENKLTSILSPSLKPEETKIAEGNVMDTAGLNENESVQQNETQLKKFTPISEMSIAHTSVLETSTSHATSTASFLSSETAVTTESGSNEADLQPMLPVSQFSTNLPSDIKDSGFESESDNIKSSVSTNNTDNKQISDKRALCSNVNIFPIQEEDESSAILGSSIEINVQNKGLDTIEISSLISGVNTAVTNDQDVRDKSGKQAFEKQLLGVGGSDMMHPSLTEQKNVDEIRDFTKNNTRENTQDLIEQKQTDTEGKDPSKNVLEERQSLQALASASEDSDNDRDRKFTSSLKAERDNSAESSAEGSDQAISIGEESKKDDTSKDDFW